MQDRRINRTSLRLQRFSALYVFHLDPCNRRDVFSLPFQVTDVPKNPSENTMKNQSANNKPCTNKCFSKCSPTNQIESFNNFGMNDFYENF
jgi:hypothetical protein